MDTRDTPRDTKILDRASLGLCREGDAESEESETCSEKRPHQPHTGVRRKDGDMGTAPILPYVTSHPTLHCSEVASHKLDGQAQDSDRRAEGNHGSPEQAMSPHDLWASRVLSATLAHSGVLRAGRHWALGA